MAKLTLTDLANLQNENSAVSNINNNNTAIETAIEKTLSRDGTLPNQMEANFDMNSHRILNLPKPVNADEPLRLQDLSDFYDTGTVSNIPPGGNQGDVLAKTSNVDYQFGWVSDSSLITAGTNIVKSGTSPVTISTSLTPTFTTVNGLTITTSTGTLTVANSKAATVSNTLTFTGTDGSSVDFGAGGIVAYKGTPLSQFASTTSAQLAGVISDETGTGALVFGTNPVLTTPNLGTPSAVTLTNGTGLPVSTGISGLATGIAAFLANPTSANLAAAVTNETGTGALVFGTSPTITGLALSSFANQAAYTFLGNNTGSPAGPTAVDIAALTTKGSPAAGDYVMISDQAASGAWKKATVSSIGSAGAVSSVNGLTGAVSITSSYGNSVTPSSPNVVVNTTLTSSSAVLSNAADVLLNNTANYFDGPSITLGTGTWYVTGQVLVTDTSAIANIFAKLWDGTTQIASGAFVSNGAGYYGTITLSGVITNPAAAVKISCRNATTVNGRILATGAQTGNTRDNIITAVRIA